MNLRAWAESAQVTPPTLIPSSWLQYELATFEETKAGFNVFFGQTQLEPKPHLYHHLASGWILVHQDEDNNQFYIRQSQKCNGIITLGKLEIRACNDSEWIQFSSREALANAFKLLDAKVRP